MTAITINTMLAIILQLLSIYLFMRSAFYLWRVREHLDFKALLFLMSLILIGIGLTSYNVSDSAYVMQRFPFNLMYYTGTALAIYFFAKTKKEDLFTIQNEITNNYNKTERFVMDKINGSPVNQGSVPVTEVDLLSLEMGKTYNPSKKTLVIRLHGPIIGNSKSISFKFSMLKGGMFCRQYHPSLQEEIYVDFGCLKDMVTGALYRSGDVLMIKSGEDHWLVATERTDGRSYLYK